MANTEFMLKKYTVDELIAHYLQEIRALKSYVKSPADETKLQTYLQAVKTFENISTKDMVQLVLSLGGSHGGKSAQIRQAFPIILGNRVMQPTAIDVEYSRLLLAYSISFKAQRGNIKEWLLNFILSSRFSPLSSVFDREISYVIQNTRANIKAFEGHLGA